MPTLASKVQPRTKLNLIRQFEIRNDGANTPVTPALQRLVGFLALQPSPARRTYVSGTLWSGADEQHASASLRSALWRLQPLQIICASSTHLWLNPCVEVDLRSVYGRALTVLRSTPSEYELLETARELVDVGDEILPGCYEDWVLAERERFRLIRLQALDRIGELLIQGGNCCDALQVGLALTQAEPLRESAHRLLIRVHLVQGNVAEAIRQYQYYEKVVSDQLNSRPTAVIRAVMAPYLASTARHRDPLPDTTHGRSAEEA